MKQYPVYVLAPPARTMPFRAWARLPQDMLSPEEVRWLRDILATLPERPKLRCIISSDEPIPLATGQTLSTLCCERWHELPEYLRTFDLRAPRGHALSLGGTNSVETQIYRAFLDDVMDIPGLERARDVNRRIDAALHALFHRMETIGSADASAFLVADPRMIRRLFGRVCNWSHDEECQASFPPLSLHTIRIKGRRNGHRFEAVQPSLIAQIA